MRDKDQFPLDDERYELDRIKADRKRNSKGSYKKKKNDKGFKMFPSKFNRLYRGKITENLRSYISLLMVGHFIFLALEIFVYHGLQIGCIINELFCMWLCYHNYLELNICMMYTYMISMFFAPFLGLMHILSFDLGLPLFLYIVQLAFYWYCGGYQMYVRVALWHRAQ
tara:strand:- start:61 stop:564 length:504 start_codon:yes stop_codon:yes gene_type:complete